MPKSDIAADVNALLQVNERLWVIEDDIRDKERAQAFDCGIHPPGAGRLLRERRAGRHQAAHQPKARLDASSRKNPMPNISPKG